VESELGIWSQGGDVNKLTRSIERTIYRSDHARSHGADRQASVRICLSASVMIDRLIEYDLDGRESGLSNEPFSSDRYSAVTGSIS
jgi:hypothetical protein